MKRYKSKPAWRGIGRKSLLPIFVFVAAFATFCLSAHAYFSFTSYSEGNRVSIGSYTASVDVSDGVDTASYSNTGIGAVKVSVSPAETDRNLSIVVRAGGSGALSFNYTLLTSYGEQSDSRSGALAPGNSAQSFDLSLAAGQSATIELLTSYAMQDIVLASDASTLSAAGTGDVVYLMKNISATALSYDESFPIIDLNGHSLNAQSITVSAAEGSREFFTLLHDRDSISAGVINAGGSVTVNSSSGAPTTNNFS